MKQSGYALLLSLFLMLGVSSFWVVSNTLQSGSFRRDQTTELEKARHALISYAVNYVDHYGVQGAGIGHLPCPDTDNPDQSHSDPWVRDGPNPPCGQALVEHGWLPRHVNTLSGRYHFHTRARQRLWYAVSSRFINNPVNRMVNPETNGNINIGSYDDIVAVLTTPPLDEKNTNSHSWWDGAGYESNSAAYAVIRAKDIRIPAMRRVADWLLSRLDAAAVSRCEILEDTNGCSFGQHANYSCSFSPEQTLQHWLSLKTPDQNCDLQKNSLSNEFARFESVPYKRHWLIRNGWPAFVEIDTDELCAEPSKLACEFMLTPIALSDRKIHFFLQPKKRQEDE